MAEKRIKSPLAGYAQGAVLGLILAGVGAGALGTTLVSLSAGIMALVAVCGLCIVLIETAGYIATIITVTHNCAHHGSGALKEIIDSIEAKRVAPDA